MRVIFAGTPEFAAKALEALIQSEHEVVMVLPVFSPLYRAKPR